MRLLIQYKLVDADEIALTLERLAFDSLHKDVRALAVLGVRRIVTRRCSSAKHSVLVKVKKDG